VPPKDLDAVVLTHAHLDHCGLLPRLAKQGFKGRIFCTEATAEIAAIVMQDSGHIQEEDAKYKRKRHEREGREGPHPVEPLYTKDEAAETVSQLEAVRFGTPVQVTDDIEATFLCVGHILGASSVRLKIKDDSKERTVLFSGDVGRWDMPILKDPVPTGRADYVVMESTYGDRLHEKTDDIPERLATIVNETCEAGGNILIPSFSVERTQDLLYHLGKLLADDRIPHLMVFVDSPMAIRVTEVFRNHPELFDADTAELLRKGQHPCDFPGLKLCRTVEESKAINHIRGSSIIIAGSGMCTGGRIKHHLVNNISRTETTLLFVGYQANGTLGRQLVDGKDRVRIHGRERGVAARIEQMGGFSAHADHDELLRWVAMLEEKPKRVFITHGDEEVSQKFAGDVAEKLGTEAHAPQFGETAVLD
jgi:metallo-beta-lactamase family protein